MERLLESCSEKFPHGILLKDEQKEVVFHLLQSKDVTILLTSQRKCLIYQLYAMAKEMQINAICCCSHCFATQKHHKRRNN